MTTSSKLEISTSLQVAKPPQAVFDAIVDPEKMKNYFISESTGRMEEGKILRWKFPEFDMNFPIRVGKVIKDSYISYYWTIDEEDLLVEITLSPAPAGQTVVTVTEKSREPDESGLKWIMQNSAGWANFLACLKAWLEYGINLREGAFDFMKP